MKTRFPLKNLLHRMGEKAWDEGFVKAVQDAVPNLDDASVSRKARTMPPEEIADGERAVIKWVSTRDIDREAEILDPSGAILTEFLLAPQVLLNHNYEEPPIGKDEWIVADDYGLKAKTRYATTARAEEIYTLNKEGVMATSSVGFVPIEYVINGGPGWGDVTRKLARKWDMSTDGFGGVFAIYTKWLLIEHSDVTVPANPHARNIMVGKGLGTYGLDLKPEPAPEPDPEPAVRLVTARQIGLAAVDIRPVGIRVVREAPPQEPDYKGLVEAALAKRQGRL